MPLIVEDGTGVSGANSYVTVAAFRAWMLERGSSQPASTLDGDTVCEQLLVKATDWLQTKLWAGASWTSSQGLAFPRVAYDANGLAYAAPVPMAIVGAQLLLADAAQAGPLVGAVRVAKFDKVKADAVFVTFSNPEGRSRMFVHAAVEALIQPFIRATPFATVRA